jgi:hypothetical protein
LWIGKKVYGWVGVLRLTGCNLLEIDQMKESTWMSFFPGGEQIINILMKILKLFIPKKQYKRRDFFTALHCSM